MSLADELFIAMCRDILDNGTSTEGEKVRPHWEDGSSAFFKAADNQAVAEEKAGAVAEQSEE